jgi:hypothetical protein
MPIFEVSSRLLFGSFQSPTYKFPNSQLQNSPITKLQNSSLTYFPLSTLPSQVVITKQRIETMTPDNTSKQPSEMSEKAASYAQEAASRVSEITDRIDSGMKKVGQQMRDQMDNVDVDEATIPDAFRKVPKYISPKVHAWLDFAVTTYFLGLGVWFAIRGRGRAATAAFINGGMVAGVSMNTDYDGDEVKPINFKMHGTLDAAQATTAALAPVLLGFADEPEAKYFWGQAANEAGVIAMTDWDAGMPAHERRRAA